jgi:WXG100 family type VII secretion target
MIKKLLMKIARKVLEQVFSVIDQQIQRIEQMVLQAVLRHVTNLDEIWRGEDAEAFKAEFNGKFIPEVNRITGVTHNTKDSLMRALDRIDQADRQISSQIGDLVQEYARIFR